MDNTFYTQAQLDVFSQDLLGAFLEAGFEIVEEPYIDYALGGFRATYVRRYLLHQPTLLYDGILTTIIHVIGLPFGHHGQKMVILSASRNLKNEPICETLKLRIQFDHDGLPSVVCNDQHKKTDKATTTTTTTTTTPTANNTTDDSHTTSENETSGCQFVSQFIKQSNQQLLSSSSYQRGQNCNINREFMRDLAKYVAHIIETISPGLIQLPIEMKLEILKKLSVESIIKMSQVNNEFKTLIFQHGETLWRHLCDRDFNIKTINRFVHSSWMELYRDTFAAYQVELCRKERALPGLPERPALLPAPYRLQIGWLPGVLELPLHEHLALEFHPLHRANSLDNVQ